jgi:hypothetical protein
VPLETEPLNQIKNVALALTEGQLTNENYLMSNCVYLKNFGNTVLKQAKSQSTLLLQKQASITIVEIAKVLVALVLSPTLQMKYKHNITPILTRLLHFVLDIDDSPQQAAAYALLNEFVGQIRLGLESFSHTEKLHGAIVLCESAFTLANTPDKFQTIFESLQLVLKDTIDQLIENFKKAVQEIR